MEKEIEKHFNILTTHVNTLSNASKAHGPNPNWVIEGKKANFFIGNTHNNKTFGQRW